MSLDQYESLKGRLLSTTAVFAISGTGVAGLAGGADAALPFALGGIAGALAWLCILARAQEGCAGWLQLVCRLEDAPGSPVGTPHFPASLTDPPPRTL